MREEEREDDEEKYEKRELPQVLRTGKRIKMNECRAAANTLRKGKGKGKKLMNT